MSSAFDQPEELAANVDIVLICVSADQDVLAMVEAIALTIKPGTIVVDMSTVSSDTAKQAAAILAEKQAAFLDAPVSGGVEGAKNGTLAMMVGGDSAALEQARPVLEAMTGALCTWAQPVQAKPPRRSIKSWPRASIRR